MDSYTCSPSYLPLHKGKWTMLKYKVQTRQKVPWISLPQPPIFGPSATSVMGPVEAVLEITFVLVSCDLCVSRSNIFCLLSCVSKCIFFIGVVLKRDYKKAWPPFVHLQFQNSIHHARQSISHSLILPSIQSELRTGVVYISYKYTYTVRRQIVHNETKGVWLCSYGAFSFDKIPIFETIIISALNKL